LPAIIVTFASLAADDICNIASLASVTFYGLLRHNTIPNHRYHTRLTTNPLNRASAATIGFFGSRIIRRPNTKLLAKSRADIPNNSILVGIACYVPSARQ
jgi:hypothetical protein